MMNITENFAAVEPFIRIEDEISKERGPFTLFALMEREQNPGRWDLVAAADWITETDLPTINYFISKIREYVPSDSPIKLAGVILLKPTDAFVQGVLQSLPPRSSRPTVLHSSLNGLGLSDAYIFSTAA